MVIGARKKSKQADDMSDQNITGTWSSPGNEEIEEEVAPREVRQSQFVRCVNMVGQYPAGSVVAATAFADWQLTNLIGNGLEYDYESDAEFTAGDPQNIGMVMPSIPQTVPMAPWINASPQNLMGAIFIRSGRVAKQEPKAEPKPEPVVAKPEEPVDPFADDTV